MLVGGIDLLSILWCCKGSLLALEKWVWQVDFGDLGSVRGRQSVALSGDSNKENTWFNWLEQWIIDVLSSNENQNSLFLIVLILNQIKADKNIKKTRFGVPATMKSESNYFTFLVPVQYKSWLAVTKLVWECTGLMQELCFAGQHLFRLTMRFILFWNLTKTTSVMATQNQINFKCMQTLSVVCWECSAHKKHYTSSCNSITGNPNIPDCFECLLHNILKQAIVSKRCQHIR